MDWLNDFPSKSVKKNRNFTTIATHINKQSVTDTSDSVIKPVKKNQNKNGSSINYRN
jgi:hypothetical protein